jgi:hypothetical protein
MHVWISCCRNGKRRVIIRDHGVCQFDEWVDDWFADQLASSYANMNVQLDREG